MIPTPENYVAITDLLARYCLCLDVEDVEGWLATRAMMTGAPGGLHLGGPPVVDVLDEGQARTQQNLLFIDRQDGSARSASTTTS